jgi:hypothetical protein
MIKTAFIFFGWFLFQNSECGLFKEGDFIYKNSPIKGIKVYRTLSTQTETIGDTLVSVFKISWKDHCKYILVPEKVIYKKKESIVSKDTVFVEITSILSKNAYKYKATTKGRVTRGTIIKIN